MALQEAIACAKIVASVIHLQQFYPLSRCESMEKTLLAAAVNMIKETSIDLCFRLKQDVGSHALMGDTGFEQMDFLQDPDSKSMAGHSRQR